MATVGISASIDVSKIDKTKLIKLGNAGFDHIRENYYWDNLIDELFIIFNDVIKNSKNTA